MGNAGNDPTSLKTIERAFDIVEWIQKNNGARVSEVAAEFDLPRSTAHNYLSTLFQQNYLTKEGDEYNISLYFLCLGGHAANNKKVFQMAKPKVQEIANETSERAQFVAEENGRGIYIHESMGDRAVQTDVRIGKLCYLHTTSVGKAILAHLPDDRIQEIIGTWGLPKATENTITEEEELFECLEGIRNRGFAFNKEERIKGQRAVGVAIEDANGETVGALSVAGPTYRMQDDWYNEEIPNLLLGIKNEVELNLTYS